MLTRFKVSGFKNLVDVDIRFGTFTCIAGANGVGKSNLFDAIRFLNMTSNTPLTDVTLGARGTEFGPSAVLNLFNRSGKNQSKNLQFQIWFDSITFSRTSWKVLSSPEPWERMTLNPAINIDYKLSLSLHTANRRNTVYTDYEHLYVNGFPIIEPLDPSTVSFEAFNSSPNDIAAKLIRIESQVVGVEERIKILGNTRFTNLAAIAPNLSFYPEAAMLQSEMTGWRILQLQSSVLGRPDNFTDPDFLADNGAHIASTLFRIANSYQNENGEMDDEYIYTMASNRLNELIGNVQSIRIDEDEERELYTLYLTDRNGTEYPARSLSDGTLRFIALITLWLDPEATGIFCIEEPENGIHPARLPALVRLLQDIADSPYSIENAQFPSRQVIVVTHSPEFVKLVPEDSLLLARNRSAKADDGTRYSKVEFVPLTGTWRVTEDTPATEVASRNELLAYLNPSLMSTYDTDNEELDDNDAPRRVMDRDDLRPIIALQPK